MARLVVIDDDQGLLEVLADIFVRAGHQVSLAGTGVEGVAQIQRERPDLVVCDVEMPALDGYGVLAVVRADPQLSSIPFLFLTGLSGEHAVRRGMNLGADDYLTKPVQPATLLAAVEARLARGAASTQASTQRLEEMRRRLAIMLPHELRTPLTVIVGGAQLLREMHREVPAAEVEGMLDAIVTAGQRLHRMAENYLMYAGLELRRLGGDQALASKDGTADPADVEEPARAAATESGREADLHFELEPVSLPLAPPFARKVVSELVQNALKFSEPGCAIRVSLRRAPGPCLAVTDAGRGMTAAQIADVSAFRQFDRALFEQQGSGLGLALVRGIALASGGTLELASTPGTGTRAALRWPG